MSSYRGVTLALWRSIAMELRLWMHTISDVKHHVETFRDIMEHIDNEHAVMRLIYVFCFPFPPLFFAFRFRDVHLNSRSFMTTLSIF